MNISEAVTSEMPKLQANGEALAPEFVAELPFRPIVIAGAPRCGTHFLHSLICTSEQASLFAPEYHYFYFMLEAYLRSLKAFNSANSAGFRDKEEFGRHHFTLMRTTLLAMWEHLGRPGSLVMKHCSLTPFLPVLARRFENMRFVVIQRDARDSVASEVRAARKRLDDPSALPMNVIENSIARYNMYYGAIVAAGAGLAGRLHCVSYEDLVRGHGIEAIGHFLHFSDIDPRKLWKRATFNIGDYSDFFLYSELWGAPISAEHIGRFQETLPEEISDQIAARTRRVSLGFEALCSVHHA